MISSKQMIPNSPMADMDTNGRLSFSSPSSESFTISDISFSIEGSDSDIFGGGSSSQEGDNSSVLTFESLSLPSVQRELEMVDEQFMALIGPEAASFVGSKITEIEESQLMEKALRTGETFPLFVLPDTTGKLVDSVDLLSEGKPLIISFLRGGWCMYCSTVIRMIRKYHPHFVKRGATVIAISPDNIEHTAEMAKEAGITFPILSDACSELAKQCQIAFKLEDEFQAAHAPYDFPNRFGNSEYVIPLPATYVVETDGTVVYSHVNASWVKRAEPIDILNLLPTLKSVKKAMKRRKRKSKNKKTVNDVVKTYLKDKLDIKLSRLRDEVPEKVMKSMFDTIEEQGQQQDGASGKSSILDTCLQVGDKLVDFKLQSGNQSPNRTISTKRIRKRGGQHQQNGGGKSMVILFYRGDWCYYHDTVLMTYQKFLKKFNLKNAQLLAISPQNLQYTKQTATKTGVIFPLLSDPNCVVANKHFRISYSVENDCTLVPKLSSKDELMRYNATPSGNRHLLLPLTATYVIDPNGTVVYKHVSTDFTKFAEPIDVLKSIPSQPVQYKKKRYAFSLKFKKWMP